jgi:hypothetical protein
VVAAGFDLLNTAAAEVDRDEVVSETVGFSAHTRRSGLMPELAFIIPTPY